MAALSSLGIGSGLDLSGLLQKLEQSEQGRLAPLQKLETSYQTKLSAYGLMKDALERIQSAAEALGETSLYRGVTVTSENEAFSVSSSSESVPGRFAIDVIQLAAAQSLVSGGQASMTDTIGQGGTITLKLGDGAGNVSSTVALNISSEQSTLSGIRDAINAADIGISASIINDGTDTPYRLVLSSKDTGTESQITVQVDDATSDGTTPLADLLGYDSATSTATGTMQQTVAASDAELKINGISIFSQSNTIKDAIQGVTLTVSQVTSSAETLVTTRDTGSIKDAFESFVSAYNNLHSIESQLTAFNGPGAENGVLLGDSTARTVQNRMRRALNTPIEGGDYFGLAQIGISLQRDGTMEIDEAMLDKALSTNLADVRTLLTGTDTTAGVATTLTGAIKELAGETGLLTTASTGLKTSIENVGQRMEAMQESIDATIARYKAQFIQLDIIMSRLSSTQSYLSQQFEALNGKND